VPHCRSAFADIEVKHREQIDPLYYIKYGPFVLATVRPETKFGDTAIAVNPKDERYAKYVGTEIEAEISSARSSSSKSSPTTTSTPPSAPAPSKSPPPTTPTTGKWACATTSRSFQSSAPTASSTDRRQIRRHARGRGPHRRSPHDMEERGLMDHVDMNYTHSIGYHDRCGTPIEPLVVEQWWLKSRRAQKARHQGHQVRRGQIVPERFTKVALDWLENLRDWNISRQNWWGIRIPSTTTPPAIDQSKPDYIIGRRGRGHQTYGEGGYEAETDNFDTWFSSGQWPFATLMATGDFDTFYPTSVMETGRDILFLWVTRMIMFGLYRTGQVPFRTVYLHGLVTDEHGKKMSKSKGNVINPLDMTEQIRHRRLRLALTIGITPGNDGALSERKIEGYRNFCNKLWNVARFILGQLPRTTPLPQPEAKTPPPTHWILAKLDAPSRRHQAIEDYRFSEAGQMVYSLLWDDFADWYIEASQVSPNHDLLIHGLQTILKLLHPIAPFVTEAIWSHYPAHDGQLITDAWPVVDITRTKPNYRQATNLNPSKPSSKPPAPSPPRSNSASPPSSPPTPTLAESADLIKRLARAAEVKLVERGEWPLPRHHHPRLDRSRRRTGHPPAGTASRPKSEKQPTSNPSKPSSPTTVTSKTPPKPSSRPA
jgi:valyl-tRNA synthetase